MPVQFEIADGRPCRLRLTRVEDAQTIRELLHTAIGETDFLNFVPGEFKFTVEQEESFLRDRIENPAAIHMVAEVEGTIAGMAGAEPLAFRRYRHHAELGMVITSDYWQIGIGRRMLQTLLAWGRHRRLHKLKLSVFAYNERAIRLYESCGFKKEGHLVDEIRRADGSYADLLLMSHFYPSET